MIRALAKGSLLWGFGNLPGGTRLYRRLTRRVLGTQATHVEKLARVWPGYARVWSERAGLDLKGKRIWIHEGGWTVFPFLLAYRLTGRGAAVTNEEGQVTDRYTEHSLKAAAALEIEGAGDSSLFPDLLGPPCATAEEVVKRTEGHLHESVHPDHIPIETGSIDLVHSGGTLEHYRSGQLGDFIAESYRVLAPGAIASHVFDHRDHLYHADKHYPFLNHLRFSESSYRLLFGHRLTFHNRLLPSQVVDMFQGAGFEVIAVRRLSLPSRTFFEGDEVPAGATLGLDRRRLHPRFAEATESDLHTAAAHYLFRKVG